VCQLNINGDEVNEIYKLQKTWEGNMLQTNMISLNHGKEK